MKTLATVSPATRPLPVAVDAGRPAEERYDRLKATLPAALRQVLDAGTAAGGSRFAEDGRFVGIALDWRPPAVVEPQQAAQARLALAELQETVLAAADPLPLLGRVFALLSHFPARGTAPEVEQVMAADWAEDLAGYPLWAVEHAARLWRRSRKWRPSIAEIRALCEDACAPERDLAKRLAAVAERGTGRGTGPACDPGASLLALAGRTVRRMP